MSSSLTSSVYADETCVEGMEKYVIHARHFDFNDSDLVCVCGGEQMGKLSLH